MSRFFVSCILICLLGMMPVIISCQSSPVKDSKESSVLPAEESIAEEKPAVADKEPVMEEKPVETTATAIEEEVTETAATIEPEPEEEPAVEEEPAEEKETEEEQPPEEEEPAEEQQPEEETPSEEIILTITSMAFQEGESIPLRYTCDGIDNSPDFTWDGVPEGTQSFVLILDDPDAPGGTFNHWVIFNIPADTSGLEEAMPKIAQLDNGAVQIRNGFGAYGYGGPCPPPGPAHHYEYTLYALDITMNLNSGATKAQVLNAMEGHILDRATLTGLR